MLASVQVSRARGGSQSISCYRRTGGTRAAAIKRRLERRCCYFVGVTDLRRCMSLAERLHPGSIAFERLPFRRQQSSREVSVASCCRAEEGTWDLENAHVYRRRTELPLMDLRRVLFICNFNLYSVVLNHELSAL